MSMQGESVPNTIVDHKERAAAIDYRRSFIVQAPAGSGKTELLTQRYLNILANGVEQPEEVLAITFTRKAAAEMRQRIVESLRFAQQESCPSEEPKKSNWQLAKAVLQRDEINQWQLLNNPNRLRIQTIDGFCTSLVKQMPIVSEHGSTPAIIEDARIHYQNAAVETLLQLGEPVAWSSSIELLLRHLDNDFNRVARMLAEMLAKRDQWLTTITGPSVRVRLSPEDLRDELEAGLQTAVVDHLKLTRQSLNDWLEQKGLAENWFSLVAFAASQVEQETPFALLQQQEFLRELPAVESHQLPMWQALAQWLVKDNGQWRKQITKKQGFPAPSAVKDKASKELYKARKAEMAELLAEFAASADDLQSLLADLVKLPSVGYQNDQWQVLAALLELLPVAAAFLKVEFQQQGVVDFVEVSQGALRALGDSDEPSDIALKLDYQIRHLLIDEFQDTSVSQFKLVEKLLAGWESGDGRTLFLVGDPMQSIYRFRQADVSLFLKSRAQGIAGVPLESLVLKTNFRSQPKIIEWINDGFSKIFPATDQVEQGGVAYSEAVAGQATKLGLEFEGVSSALLFSDEDSLTQTVERIQKIKEHCPADSIAVLLRARSHGQQLTQRLVALGLPVRAVEMESLFEQPVIQDLLSLTRALSDLSDRIAWLSVLRAPWCGATLQDLLVLVQLNEQNTLYGNLIETTNNEDNARLNLFSSPELFRRLCELAGIFRVKLQERQRDSLRSWVESCWYALSAPNYCDEVQQSHASAFFQLLDRLDENSNTTITAQTLTQAVAELKADSLTQDESAIEVMTIHKSKGLEFDHVIIPALEKKGRSDTAPLLDWSLNTRAETNQAYLVMAPIKPREIDSEPVTTYLRYLDSRKSAFEVDRLFYVAATRAKKSLHCFSALRGDEEKETLKQPEKGSFFAALDKAALVDWQSAQQAYGQWISEFRNSAEEHSADQGQQPDFEDESKQEGQWLQRIPLASIEQAVGAELTSDTEFTDLTDVNSLKPTQDYEAKLRTSSGVVFHRLIESLATRASRGLDLSKVAISAPSIQQALRLEGIEEADLTEQSELIALALERMLADDRGRWILRNHSEAACEYALSFLAEGITETIIIDRTFVDAEGSRWIIDYKLPQQSSLSKKQFKQLVSKYEPQLRYYARVMQRTEQRPIKLGLYLPYQQLWHEYSLEKAELMQQELLF